MAKRYSQSPSRAVKCQICSWTDTRWYGKGILVKPCPECGSRVMFAKDWPGDQAVTPDPKSKKVVPFQVPPQPGVTPIPTGFN